MFEPAEVGRRLSAKRFKAAEGDLRTRLLQAQRTVREHAVPVVVIVAGVEGAGKGAVVSRLSEWLDARGLITHAFWTATDEETRRPYYWRFWRALPPRGQIGVLFGSWYTQPIVDHALKRMDQLAFEHSMSRVRDFERMLQRDGTLFVKLWFHLKADTQRARLEADRKRGIRSPLLKAFHKSYKRFAKVSERAIRLTDTGIGPWHVIEAEDERYRDLAAGEALLTAMETRVREARQPAGGATLAVPEPPAGDGHLPQAEGAPNLAPTAAADAIEHANTVTVLSRVPLDKRADPKAYDRRLAHLQARANRLTWAAHDAGVNSVCVFEGWDAAGKGGAIRRLTWRIDARLRRVISVAAPTDEERAHHYLWRFWRHVPRGGHVTIYDRSWYGRVLVERVEGFASPDEWGRAYKEINDFEEQLFEHGGALLKYWLHIDPDEQLRRFKEREVTPWKQHKLTAEDWRNRDKWPLYEAAVNDMVARTSTAYAPWTLVPGNDKKHARLYVLERFCDTLEQRLDERRAQR